LNSNDNFGEICPRIIALIHQFWNGMTRSPCFYWCFNPKKCLLRNNIPFWNCHNLRIPKWGLVKSYRSVHWSKKIDFLIYEVNCEFITLDIADIFWKFLGLNNLFFYSLQDSQKKFCHQMALSHFSFLIFALKFKLSQNEFCSKKALEKISIFCFNIFFHNPTQYWATDKF